jgi:hypothetical protein
MPSRRAEDAMDWNAVIERNSRALRRLLAMLVAMAGLDMPILAGETVPGHSVRFPPRTLPRRLHRAVLRLLRPAESAMRRLVIIAARGVVVPAPRLRPHEPTSGSSFVRNGHGTGIVLPRGFRLPDRPVAAPRQLVLPLLDPLRRKPRHRRPAAAVPRISMPGYSRPFPVAPRHPCAPDDPLDASRLLLRLDALGRVLDDLPAHALRFARWRSRNKALLKRERAQPAAVSPRRTRFRRVFPLRYGRPPGSCRRSAHEVHEILRDIHGLTLDLLDLPDTS